MAGKDIFFSFFARVLQLLFGMLVVSLGVALITSSQLGTSPVSTVPYAASAITGLTFGQASFAVNVLLILTQLALLRRRTPWSVLFQIPSAAVLGVFIDFSMGLVGALVPLGDLAYWARFLMSLAGNVLLAAGIVVQVDSRTVVQPGEGVVLALSRCLHAAFGNVKIGFDVTMVSTAALLSFLFAPGVVVVREGTLVTALMIGSVIKVIRRFFPEKKV